MWKHKSKNSITSLLSKYSQAVRDNYGISIKTQKKSLHNLAIKGRIPPIYYYKYKLFDSNLRLDHILFNSHYIPLFSRLFRNEKTELISNKYLFDKEISSIIDDRVQTIAISDKNGVRFIDGYKQLPDNDIFIKPVCGSAGRKCMSIKKIKDGFNINNKFYSFDSDELFSFINKIGYDEPMLVQKNLQNNSKITHLSNGALASNRINTYIDKDGEVQVLFSMFLMPVGESSISNGVGGSILADVDLQEGKVGNGIKMGNPYKTIEKHPDTNHRIKGTLLPDWDKAKSLCKRAHSLFQDIPFLGWDVCYTNEGPMIIEANLNWSIEAWQMTHENFDKDFFLDILYYHVSRYFNGKDLNTIE